MTKDVHRIINKETRQLVDKALAAGWVIDDSRVSRQHLRLVPPDPDQPFIVFSSAPSDRRAYLNFRARLRRAGLEC